MRNTKKAEKNKKSPQLKEKPNTTDNITTHVMRQKKSNEGTHNEITQKLNYHRQINKYRRIKNKTKMSITISTCDEICHSPVNNSQSKMLYSFPKSSRFPQRKRILCDKFYDSRSISPDRTTTFGFGNKYDFTKQSTCAPPPNTYNLKDDFEKNPKKGFGFGQGREQMTVTGPLMQTIRNKNPGPGSYALIPTFNKLSYSFSGKLNRQDKEKMKLPGPGQYPVTFALSQNGTYFLSKYKSSMVRNFSRLEDRCKTADNRVPGPGHYDTSKIDLSPTGKYSISKILNCTTRKFDGFAARGDIIDKKETPGPGNYRLPSEFGHYLSKKALKKHLSMANMAARKQQKKQQKQQPLTKQSVVITEM